MYSTILSDEEEATEETEIYNWTLGDQDCVVLKQMVQTKNNSIEADVQDFDFNQDPAIDVEQLPPHQDESQCG
jgi:transcription initiation factor IIF auxiliary subunit